MENVINDKSFQFGVRVLKTVRKLRKDSGEYEIASQLLRSGTSIGANVSEAQYAQSKRDFASKMAIARKEANETKYWLQLLAAAEILPEAAARELIGEVTEIVRILTAIIKTAIDTEK